MKSKSILLLLGNSSLYDSEATQFNRVSITVTMKVLGPAPASFRNFLADREHKRLPALTLGRGEQVARAPAPSSRSLAARLPQNLEIPRLCAVTEGSSPALNKPRQAQAEPVSGSSLLRAPPGAGDASLPPKMPAAGAPQTQGARALPPPAEGKGPGGERRAAGGAPA